ncbi:MAG TPA: type II toxin-antitoxin system YafQ family toxin [Longimicrobiales bacterium]|nr:type II toxin-antitoxin system YafQ family toxin [Longimicrobiales bacterium]
MGKGQRSVMVRLIAQERLEERHLDHELSGEWKGHRDCHIRPDWILIYRVAGETITFERTGTHSDLFS